jgi:hypothetical protein
VASWKSFGGAAPIEEPGVYRALIEVDDGAHVSNYGAPIMIR